jgi:enterochelin esterase-like enzyme
VPSIFERRQSLLDYNTPLRTIAAAAPALRRAHTFFWLYTGTDDRFRPQNVAFASELAKAGLRHRFRLVDGGHDWALWRGNAALSYLAASRHLHRVA